MSAPRTNSIGQNFAEAIADSDSWRRQADQLLATAFYLAPKARVPQSPSHEASELAVGSLKVTLLLLALAVENALKAIKASRGKLTVEAGKLKRGTLGGGRAGHSLLVLADEVGVSLSADEAHLLEKLSSAVLWSGKYQHPLDEAAFLAAVELEPRSLRTPHDLDLTWKFINRMRSESGG